jgi:hypothetical protein
VRPRFRIVARLGLGLQAACVTSVALYAGFRMAQAASTPHEQPGPGIVAGAHAGYFWRVWTVSYAGAMVGFFAFAAARVREAQVARGLLVALWVAVALMVVQGALVP